MPKCISIHCEYYCRPAESRSSLCKLAYEEAKLELLHLKQEIMIVITLFLFFKLSADLACFIKFHLYGMQKKFQAVSTAVKTSEILKLNCAKLLRQHGFHSTGLLNPEQAHEVTRPI